MRFVVHSPAAILAISSVAGLAFSSRAHAQCVPGTSTTLTSGTTGTDSQPSFDGRTRGVDVTVLGATGHILSSMTAALLNISGPATVSARVYHGGISIASGSVSVPGGVPQTAVVPISAALMAGETYRLAFFVDEPCCITGHHAFDPNPTGSGGFPYVEATGALRIEQAYESPGLGVFPSTQVDNMPYISVQTNAMAPSIALTSGTTGTDSQPSFDGRTRGVDVTVLGATNRCLSSMKATLLNISGPATVSARVYHGGISIAFGSVSVPGGVPETAVVPLSATLMVGETYRLAFFVDEPCCITGHHAFDPTPVGSGGFPYVDATGALRIEQAYESPGLDAFPSTQVDNMPYMSVQSVQIDDLAAPVLTCPPLVSVIDSKGGPFGEFAFFTVTASDDVDPSPSVVCVPPSGSFFPRGTTMVTCTATDLSGNQSMCTFPVVVLPTTRRQPPPLPPIRNRPL